MGRKKLSLPQGWFPRNKAELERQLAEWEETAEKRDSKIPEDKGIAGVLPHAGWAFSGELAYRVLRKLRKDVDVVVVVGGHLRSGDPVTVWMEDEVETPTGSMQLDNELRQAVLSETKNVPERGIDNTVEVQVPMVHALYPNAKLLALRFPPDRQSLAAGESLARLAEDKGLRIVVAGSTDLTHYGPSYGFQPFGGGAAARDRVEKELDRPFIRACLDLNGEQAVSLAASENSACSPGAAAGAASFAAASGVETGTLLEYRTSYAIHPAESFVGYAAIVYPL
ncbi:MAG: AmmeMemoRadiSam system protein B [Spirochaetales bacterium]|nr:AmmeMemoRadiSam system protein B [Spirochaetales bacterium]MCF7938213.1 AmmeMemoRadiSam system protein B [Spirochaetales bacterium]